MVQEIFDEAATLLHNGLTLDHLDDHDGDIVISELCLALTDADPTTALLTRFYAATDKPTDLHDPSRCCPGLRERSKDLAAMTLTADTHFGVTAHLVTQGIGATFLSATTPAGGR